MASDVLKKLKPDKRTTIEESLLLEFTHHPVTEAQVARIVKGAGISRGAFYNYFKDVPDAYRYLYQIAIQDIHQAIRQNERRGENLVDEARQFIKNTQNSKYYELFQMHYHYNEVYVTRLVAPLEPHAEIQWAEMTLIHDTIRCALIEPGTTDARLHQLEKVLKILEE
ncbi:MAG: TetR/AcrR family transcriptional regulator [Pediococcus pentosaceus]|nr:TetR/AcrR family transcriptional regulator [Pediococcus pentosaceus]MCI1295735.1 TetR/AcrR family transcriptional regulator [Pediococcus pentosaceus]